MIISHTHRFVFLKTRKTASTSMQIAFSRICDPEADVIIGESAHWDGHNSRFVDGYYLWAHTPAAIVFELFPDARDYFIFSFERDPWSKCVSCYDWHYARNPDIKELSFRGWLLDSKFREFPSDFQVYSEQDEVVGEVYPYNDMDTHLSALKQRFGDFGELPVRNRYNGLSRDYVTAFDSEMDFAVRRAFQKELKHFEWMEDLAPCL